MNDFHVIVLLTPKIALCDVFFSIKEKQLKAFPVRFTLQKENMTKCSGTNYSYSLMTNNLHKKIINFQAGIEKILNALSESFIMFDRMHGLQ